MLDYGNYKIQKDWKGYQSYDLEDKPLIFSGSEWECSYWTDRLLKARQDQGWSTP